MPPPLDLLIIGAGPVGLATAVGAYHRGARNILVVEQAHALRPVGQGIDLLSNALTALHYLHPRLTQLIQPFRRYLQPGRVVKRNVTPKGRHLKVTDPAKHGGHATILWWQLQQLLLSCLPEGVLVLNHQLVDIVQEEEFAVAEFVAGRVRENKFKNWDEGRAGTANIAQEHVETFEGFEDVGRDDGDARRVRCRAIVVVGADGINSVARRCLYRDVGRWEPYATAEYVGLYRTLKMGNAEMEAEDEHLLKERFLHGASLSLITCEEKDVGPESVRLILVDVPKSLKTGCEWTCIYYFAMDLERAKTLGKDDLFREAVRKAREAGFHETVVKLSEKLWAFEGEKVARPMFVVPVTQPPPYEPLKTAEQRTYPKEFRRPWYWKRLVLVGDAKHGAPPSLGQGSGMGLEDAYVLVTKMAEREVWNGGRVQVKDLEKIFDEYVKARMERVCLYQRYSVNRVSEYRDDVMDNVRDSLWTFPYGVAGKRTE